MNFNKEIKHTHDEIMQLHEKINSLRDALDENSQDVISKIDSLSEYIKENPDLGPLGDPQKINMIKVDIQQPKTISNILCILIILNICVTGSVFSGANLRAFH